MFVCLIMSYDTEDPSALTGDRLYKTEQLRTKLYKIESLKNIKSIHIYNKKIKCYKNN